MFDTRHAIRSVIRIEMLYFRYSTVPSGKLRTKTRAILLSLQTPSQLLAITKKLQWSLYGALNINVTKVSFCLILDVDNGSTEPVRAWIVSKTDNQLHIRVYLQHSNSNGPTLQGSANVQLLSHGCNPERKPTVIADFGLQSQLKLCIKFHFTGNLFLYT